MIEARDRCVHVSSWHCDHPLSPTKPSLQRLSLSHSIEDAPFQRSGCSLMPILEANGNEPDEKGQPLISPHLILYIPFKIVQANTTLTERLGLAEGHAGDGRNHDTKNCQGLFKGELGRVSNVVFEVGPPWGGDARARSPGEYFPTAQLEVVVSGLGQNANHTSG